jgi:DNA-binding NarL/FixJ family response regulator
MASILLVEDHAMVASSLSRVLQERGQFDVAAVAGSGEAALEKLEALQVDLVLIDVSLPQMSGIELVGAIRQRDQALPCLMLSGHVSTHYVERAMAAGANGYVLKDSIPGILEGIEHVLGGETFISEELRDRDGGGK